MGDVSRGILLGPLLVATWFAGPVTYILCVVDTWQGRSPVILKLLINVTLDAFLSFIWPVTWMLWLVMEAMGRKTPITTVLGF